MALCWMASTFGRKLCCPADACFLDFDQRRAPDSMQYVTRVNPTFEVVHLMISENGDMARRLCWRSQAAVNARMKEDIRLANVFHQACLQAQCSYIRQSLRLADMSLLHSTVPHVRARLPMDPKLKAAKRASCRPPPPPQKMSAYTAGPVRLLYRIDIQTEDNLLAAIRRSGLPWTLHEFLNVPHCTDLEGCSVCSLYIDHLINAWTGDDEDIEMGDDEQNNQDQSDGDQSDDEVPPGPMDQLFALMHLRCRMKAYDADLTDEKAMARLEGAMVELFGDKVDALIERDEAIDEQTVLRAKLEYLQAAHDELANTSQKQAAECETERARVAVLAEKLDATHTETCRLRTSLARETESHRQSVESQHSTVAELKELLARVSAERDLLKKFVEDSNCAGFAELRQRIDVALYSGQHLDSRKRQRVAESADGVRRLPASTSRAQSTNRVGTKGSSWQPAMSAFPTNSNPGVAVASDALWQTFSRMRKPTAHDDPREFARWLQFNSDVQIQGVPIDQGTVDLRDIRGHHQVTARALPKQRGSYSNLYFRSFFALLRVLAIPGRYAELIQDAGVQVAESITLTPCAFADGRPLSDLDVTRFLAAKGMTIEIANDCWQYCFNFLEAESKHNESGFGLANVLELLERIRQREAVHGRPPGLYPPVEDRYSKVDVPDKRRRR
ncbi:hypothetical protein C8R47DRAFT_1065328 [Mycena vitilis]|nr:hypothetical protein C8R47DRAFT_1065328 [Mycena vitilis]